MQMHRNMNHTHTHTHTHTHSMLVERSESARGALRNVPAILRRVRKSLCRYASQVEHAVQSFRPVFYCGVCLSDVTPCQSVLSVTQSMRTSSSSLTRMLLWTVC